MQLGDRVPVRLVVDSKRPFAWLFLLVGRRIPISGACYKL